MASVSLQQPIDIPHQVNNANISITALLTAIIKSNHSLVSPYQTNLLEGLPGILAIACHESLSTRERLDEYFSICVKSLCVVEIRALTNIQNRFHFRAVNLLVDQLDIF